MQRSSDSIGAIAAALAKAQAELSNPEKSRVATIRSPFPRESDRIFRYAPLSSGLEIVRKSLGRHEIATVQTTEIDKDAGLVRLTTVLAHSSGEWLSSDRPVCPISDTGSPQRMGAALTFARRYALFTLVGIAGEDDLDAPDLGAIPKAGVEQPPRSDHRRQSNGHAAAAGRPSWDGGKLSMRSARPVLAPEQSAILRERMVLQLAGIETIDDAAAWAHRNLPAKNTLTALYRAFLASGHIRATGGHHALDGDGIGWLAEPRSIHRCGELRLQNCRWLHKPMTSFRQIEANRGNALKSTGPKTEDGKRRSRRNAVRHGLTAETVVVALEDIEDYQAIRSGYYCSLRRPNCRGARTGAPACFAAVAHAPCHRH